MRALAETNRSGAQVGDAVALPPPRASAQHEGVKGAGRVKIGADGNIVSTEYDDYCSNKGFRPGQAALGDIKKSWTLTDFLLMDDEYNFKIKRQEKAHCAAVSLDTDARGRRVDAEATPGLREDARRGRSRAAAADKIAAPPRTGSPRRRPPRGASAETPRPRFARVGGTPTPPPERGARAVARARRCVAFQGYCQQLGWRQQRVGFLYGTFEEDGSARVEAIYEPPQEGRDRGFELLEDERAEQVEALAALLGLRRVGWIVACPPREDGFVLSGDEVVAAALEQLEAAQGVEETPFVTVRVTVNEAGEANFEASARPARSFLFWRRGGAAAAVAWTRLLYRGAAAAAAPRPRSRGAAARPRSRACRRGASAQLLDRGVACAASVPLLDRGVAAAAASPPLDRGVAAPPRPRR